MPARTIWFFTVAVVVFSLAQISMGNGGLTGTIDLTSNLGDPNNVAPSTSISIYVSGTQSGASTGLNNVQLNWSGSDSELNLDTTATWIWDADTNVINGLGDDADVSDFAVSRIDTDYITAASFDIGTLTFNAPSDVGTYNVSLDGYSSYGVDNTWFNEGTTWIIEGLGLTLDSFTFTVVPEPTAAILLGIGGLALLRRRRK